MAGLSPKRDKNWDKTHLAFRDINLDCLTSSALKRQLVWLIKNPFWLEEIWDWQVFVIFIVLFFILGWLVGFWGPG